MMKSAVNIQRSRTAIFVALSFIILLIYQKVSAAPTVTITPDQTIADKFIRHTVTGIKTPLPQLPDVPGFLGASFLVVGDLNNDGVLDIVCSSGEGSDVDAFTNNGEIAVFTWDGKNLDNWTQGIINNTFVFPNDPVLADMDEDGDLDILIGDNFLFGFVTGFHAGIYWLENLGGVLTDPSNWVKQTIYEGGANPTGNAGLMHIELLDVDGDGKDDIITSRVDLGTWQSNAPKPPPTPPPANEPQFTFMEIFKKEDSAYIQNDADGIAGKGGTCYGYSRHVIGDGGGFQFSLGDIDDDGDFDIYAPQYLITYSGALIARPDIHGDSLLWFENPGPSAAALDPWPRHTISNNNTSNNPLGRGFMVLDEDIDHDGKKELIYSTNNHQDYKAPDTTHRLWPAGVFFLDIPTNPADPANWPAPITLETGDPNLDPTDQNAVANDLYACDRPGSPLESGAPGDIKTGDFNKDGYLDLVVPGDSKGAVYYYESNRSSSKALKFKRASLYVDPGSMSGGCKIFDIDGDGDLDIVQAIYDTSVLQKGDPGFVELASSSIFVYENTSKSGICPAKTVLGKANAELNILHALRDKIFVKSKAGQHYTALYYNHAFELRKIFAHDQTLRDKAHQLIQSMLPAIGSLIEKKEPVIDKDIIQQTIALIDLLKPVATPSLSRGLNRVKKDILSGSLLYNFKLKLQN